MTDNVYKEFRDNGAAIPDNIADMIPSATREYHVSITIYDAGVDLYDSDEDRLVNLRHPFRYREHATASLRVFLRVNDALRTNQTIRVCFPNRRTLALYEEHRSDVINAIANYTLRYCELDGTRKHCLPGLYGVKPTNTNNLKGTMSLYYMEYAKKDTTLAFMREGHFERTKEGECDD